MKIVEAHEITKYFEDKKAVDTVSLAVNRGDFFGLLVSTIAVILVSGYLFKSDSLIKDIEKQMQKAGNKAQ